MAGIMDRLLHKHCQQSTRQLIYGRMDGIPGIQEVMVVSDGLHSEHLDKGAR
jgi:hypothetical protein